MATVKKFVISNTKHIINNYMQMLNNKMNKKADTFVNVTEAYPNGTLRFCTKTKLLWFYDDILARPTEGIPTRLSNKWLMVDPEVSINPLISYLKILTYLNDEKYQGDYNITQLRGDRMIGTMIASNPYRISRAELLQWYYYNPKAFTTPVSMFPREENYVDWSKAGEQLAQHQARLYLF